MARNKKSVMMARRRSAAPKESIWTTNRLKNYLLVVTSGMLLPICPSILLTIRSYVNNNQYPPIDPYTRKTWHDYLKESSYEQVIDGTVVERRNSAERLRIVEMYYQRWIANHQSKQEEHLRYRCSNRNKLCIFWASTGECDTNPGFMEDVCVLACLRCDRLIEEVF